MCCCAALVKRKKRHYQRSAETQYVWTAHNCSVVIIGSATANYFNFNVWRCATGLCRRMIRSAGTGRHSTTFSANSRQLCPSHHAYQAVRTPSARLAPSADTITQNGRLRPATGQILHLELVSLGWCVDSLPADGKCQQVSKVIWQKTASRSPYHFALGIWTTIYSEQERSKM